MSVGIDVQYKLITQLASVGILIACYGGQL